jgi:hypothetical protein
MSDACDHHEFDRLHDAAEIVGGPSGLVHSRLVRVDHHARH